MNKLCYTAFWFSSLLLKDWLACNQRQQLFKDWLACQSLIELQTQQLLKDWCGRAIIVRNNNCWRIDWHDNHWSNFVLHTTMPKYVNHTVIGNLNTQAAYITQTQSLGLNTMIGNVTRRSSTIDDHCVALTQRLCLWNRSIVSSHCFTTICKSLRLHNTKV